MLDAKHAREITRHASSARDIALNGEVKRVCKLIQVAATFKKYSVEYTPISLLVNSKSIASSLKKLGYKVRLRRLDNKIQVLWDP
tara:strand:- start:242 stop:496 length:255 start_codon:yes stop_codon:yes gene_type:complete